MLLLLCPTIHLPTLTMPKKQVQAFQQENPKARAWLSVQPVHTRVLMWLKIRICYSLMCTEKVTLVLRKRAIPRNFKLRHLSHTSYRNHSIITYAVSRGISNITESPGTRCRALMCSVRILPGFGVHQGDDSGSGDTPGMWDGAAPAC